MPAISSNRFDISIEGFQKFSAVSVSGLSLSTECLDAQDSAKQMTANRKGKSRCDRVVIRRIFEPENDDLHKWFYDCLSGSLKKLSGSIIIHSDSGEEICRFNFGHAWPVRWSAPSFDGAEVSTVAIEAVVLSIEDLHFKTGGKSIPGKA